VLGLVGAVIDFIAGISFISQSMVTSNDMGVMVTQYNQNAIDWAIGLFILGGFLLVTSLLSVSSFGMMRMNIFGPMMIIYGIVMIGIGVVMLSGMTPMMNGSLYSSLAMFVVGIAMLLNGLLMTIRSSGKVVHSMPHEGIKPQN
jgi:hypothetical protein